MCSDLDFWKVQCLKDSQNATKYVESRRCATYENKSLKAAHCQSNEIYCSNKGKCLDHVNFCSSQFYFGNETQCQSHAMYHCHKSNQCIWQDWVCDGFVQCLEGEDEDFDLCYSRGSFAEGATIKCDEAIRYGYNVTILATKCNGIVECKNGIDEVDCENNDKKGLIAVGILFMTVAIIWIAIHIKFSNDDTSQESKYDPSSLHYKGDKLSHIKVGFLMIQMILHLSNIFPPFELQNQSDPAHLKDVLDKPGCFTPITNFLKK